MAGSSVTRKISGMLPGAEDLHPAEPLGERHLGGVIDVQAAEDEGPVVLQGLERPRRQGVVAEQPVAVDPDDLRTDGGTELLGGATTVIRLSFTFAPSAHV